MEPSSSKSVFTTPPSFFSPPPKRPRVETSQGCTILFTGLAKSGKSTLSNRLTTLLKDRGIPVNQLDGKDLASGLCSPAPLREHFVHIASETAKLFNKEGFISIISIVAPNIEDREAAKASHFKDGLRFLEVWVDRPREQCERETGFAKNLIKSIDANYQPPTHPDIHLHRDENNVDALFSQLLDRLMERRVIPSLFIQPKSPATPSSTTTHHSSGIESEDEEGTVFKIPQNGTAIRAVFDQVKKGMIEFGFNGSDADITNGNAYFQQVMSTWTDHYNRCIDPEDMFNPYENRFFPVFISQSLVNKQKNTSTKSPETPNKTLQDEWISVYWAADLGIIKFGKIQVGRSFHQYSKCVKCWQKSTATHYLCNNHSTNIMLHLAVLVDNNNKESRIYAYADQRSVKMKPWDNHMLRSFAKHKKLTTMQTYFTSHPNCKFTGKVKSILFPSPGRQPLMQTTKLSLALICLLRNIARAGNENILPHMFLQAELDMPSADLAAVERTLEQNGITFTVRESENPHPPTSQMALKYCDKLPRVYVGIEKNDKVGIGLKTAKDSGVGSRHTHSTGFRAGPLYQPTISPEQLAVVNYVPPIPQPDWTPEELQQQQAIDQKMKEELDGLEKEFGSDCRRKEALGIAALVIAEMKGLNRHDGVPIRRHNKRFNHLNTAEEGDYERMI
ncbi:Bifunctional 3'-phosphoadenosine 5'-phosphosulfate synthase [Folsomia candida]|uniref:Bifunctional 3'-phosphoadenosine 5'-phosphosulfate synthase n=1 Tax=Folsomia candida TaxID=158441 RepID=A0A226F210_FOLCA|nr:Bifunctional 3'-phosphoadenosine 5'-phosphosulfate synthase [Folsomia candida]